MSEYNMSKHKQKNSHKKLLQTILLCALFYSSSSWSLCFVRNICILLSVKDIEWDIQFSHENVCESVMPKFRIEQFNRTVANKNSDNYLDQIVYIYLYVSLTQPTWANTKLLQVLNWQNFNTCSRYTVATMVYCNANKNKAKRVYCFCFGEKKLGEKSNVKQEHQTKWSNRIN